MKAPLCIWKRMSSLGVLMHGVHVIGQQEMHLQGLENAKYFWLIMLWPQDLPPPQPPPLALASAFIFMNSSGFFSRCSAVVQGKIKSSKDSSEAQWSYQYCQVIFLNLNVLNNHLRHFPFQIYTPNLKHTYNTP